MSDGRSDEIGVEAAAVDDAQRRAKDTAESPGSERETRAKQDDPPSFDGVDDGAVRVAPGTGGPDDVGDVEVDERDIRIPGRVVEP